MVPGSFIYFIDRQRCSARERPASAIQLHLSSIGDAEARLGSTKEELDYPKTKSDKPL